MPERRLRVSAINNIKKFIEKCNGCEKTNECAGFFEWHKNEIGYKNIGKEYL